MRRSLSTSIAVALVAALPFASFAKDHDNETDDAGSAQAQASAEATVHADPSVLLAGLVPVATDTAAYLRFVNAGMDAGAATVTLYAASTGVQLATWTSASLASLASVQVALADIAAQATPALTIAQSSAAVDLRVTATFRGDVQAVVWNAHAGAIANASSCRSAITPEHLFGYVEGPTTANLSAALRIANASTTQTSHATLTLYKASDGTKLATWTSPDVPPNASMAVSVAALAAAATPVVDPTTPALTITADALHRLRVEHLAVATASGVAADLTPGCGLHPTHDESATAAANEDANKKADDTN